MMTAFVDLGIRGVITTCLVIILEASLARFIHPRWRRLWWVLVPLAWLAPFHLLLGKLLPRAVTLVSWAGVRSSVGSLTESFNLLGGTPYPGTSAGKISFTIWIAGAVVVFLLVAIRTVKTSRRWHQERLCTDSRLLDLLEDCKSTAGITAPIGLVLSPAVSMPALLGCLHPRILLPEWLPASASEKELRAILLHELAHFRSADIPLQWLFACVLMVHWYNPVAHWGVYKWRFFREIAADAAVLGWLPESERTVYGQALIDAVRHPGERPLPSGALALSEPLGQLKQRLAFIAGGETRQPRGWLVALVAAALAVLIAFPSPTQDRPLDPDTARVSARPAAESWLKTVDAADYRASWAIASTLAQKLFTFDAWREVSEKTRESNGALKTRNFVSSTYLNQIPQASGKFINGDFVVFHYDTSFQKLANGQETVWMMKDVDEQWRPCGYLVSPRDSH